MVDALGGRTDAFPRPTPDPVLDTLSADTVPKAASPARLACRRMNDADLPAAVALLSAGFPERPAAYWQQALDRLRARTVPKGRPRYGYVMTDHDKLVGIVLTIFATTDTAMTRANVSSWYVEPAYRGFSHLLLAIPLKLEDVTLFNISPTPSTIETITAQGFARYSSGAFQAIACLARPVARVRLRRITRDTLGAPALLAEHAGWGCLCFELTHRGTTYPFVFAATRILGGRMPCAQLVYCRDVGDFVRFAGPLGRRLLRHGLPVVMVDADARLPRLLGSLRPVRAPRVFRGTTPPRVGDLASSELAIFGP